MVVKINDTEYNLPTSWNDISMKKYIEIVKAKDKTFAERLSVYSDIPFQVINFLSFNQIKTISDIVEFCDSFDVVNAFAQESEIKIAEQPYWKIEKAKQLLKDVQPVTVSVEIVDLYTSDSDGNGGMDISDKPVTEVIGLAAFFLRNCQTSLTDIKG